VRRVARQTGTLKTEVSGRLQPPDHITVMLTPSVGLAIAEAVSRLFPTAASGFEPRSGHVAFVVDKVALPFPLPILIPPTAPHSSWYSGRNSGRRTKWTSAGIVSLVSAVYKAEETTPTPQD
jgi:hypothetical protein